MSKKTIKTSTPLFPSRRKPLRDDLEENNHSPIYNPLKMTDLNAESQVPDQTKVIQEDKEKNSQDSDTEYHDSENENGEIKDKCEILPKTEPENNLNSLLFFIGAIALLITSLAWFKFNADDVEKVSLDKIRRNFPAQNDDLWLALNSALNDIKTFDKPANLMLLYEEKSAETLEKLLKEISYYSVCILKNCQLNPIILTAQQMNSTVFLNDYGNLIEYFKPQLMERGVMIIHNLESITGQTAQAFHTFCDEFTPLVNKALFIFTVKTDEFGGNSLEVLEEYFKNKWTDIKRDTFYALFTRITSMPLEILPESL